jgi:5-methylcytosine-specific restriction endonuclease McrBC regulatory subunit McrC
VIRVPERGTVDVPIVAWREASRSPVFWSLVERGVVTVEQLRGGRARLTGGCYVGRSRVAEGLVLEMHEKIAGSLAALLRFASGTDFRVKHVPGPSSELGPLIALLVTHSVDAVRRYAARGRLFMYEKLSKKGSLVGGRLDVARTTRLWARGLRHLAAFDKNVVTFNLPINRSILSALREVERIGRLIQLPRDVVARVRTMALLFDDCRNAEVLFGARTEAARRAEKLAESASDKAIADMLALAAIILSHESFEHDSSLAGTAPRSWFLNLESLFERAVRETMRAAVGSTGSVVAGRLSPPPIFPPRSDAFRANPDLVIRRGSSLPCVGDVKYKQWSRLPSASDVYQLLVHASAFGAKQAFLVFPGDAFDVQVLGDAVTGARASTYGVDVRVLDDDIKTMLQDLGVLSSPVVTARGAPSGAA